MLRNVLYAQYDQPVTSACSLPKQSLYAIALTLSPTWNSVMCFRLASELNRNQPTPRQVVGPDALQAGYACRSGTTAGCWPRLEDWTRE